MRTYFVAFTDCKNKAFFLGAKMQRYKATEVSKSDVFYRKER